MDISRCSVQLFAEIQTVGGLPEETLAILRDGTTPQYLDTLARLALSPKYLYTIYATHEPVFIDICSRWLAYPETEALSSLAALARILPSAPHLKEYAEALLRKPRRGVLGDLGTCNVTALVELPVGSLLSLLLTLYRLLLLDNQEYAAWVSPAQLQLLLKHDHRSIRYLAVRILCLYLHAADGALVSMINTCVGEGTIQGVWEETTIDYTFFSLWESKRLKDLDDKLQNNRSEHRNWQGDSNMRPIQRIVQAEDLAGTTAWVAGVLVPRIDATISHGESLVATECTNRNLTAFAHGVNTGRPLLVTGKSGAGKTSVIKEASRQLGKTAAMLTLHLNEQSDIKLLVGMYTSSITPGSFSWRPGVLTTAVMEGKWVLIEDLDRAPKDVISTLLPLIERRELLVPNWGKTIRAGPGFKLIATMRSTQNTKGEEVISASSMIGLRHWQRVSFQMPPDEEFAEIAYQKCPVLRSYIPRMINVYTTLKDHEKSRSSPSTKSLGPRDFLRWSRRIEALLIAAGITSRQEPISEELNDQIFLEAVECLVGDSPSGSPKEIAIHLIAQGLHVSVQRVNHCLKVRRPAYANSGHSLRVGRANMKKKKCSASAGLHSQRSGHDPFAISDIVLRILESVAIAVQHAEPCLLVGETGAGKTTIVQRLASSLNRKLIVVNLSQQSEAGDLLGGHKPINMRALAVPMKEDFDELLGLTFPSHTNQHYIDALGNAILKGRWSRVLTLWLEALRMIETKSGAPRKILGEAIEEPSQKKRKLLSRYQNVRIRWQKFAEDVEAFKMHLASGSKVFAFSFIEGNIVKAARNGDWVLLDEINLASPDTLESLADLFSLEQDGGPSIMLPDTGNAERIRAHKDFRIFAAMNPATDVAKRDLPLSLRSRFTEIFIEAPDNDLDNLVSIVKVYLGNHCNTDVRAATDIAHLYLEIKKLLEERRLVDGANQSPHFSLRTLTRTLVFVTDITPIYGLRRALLEGFSLGFLTSLGKDSESLLRPLIDKHILSSAKNRNAILHQTPRVPQDGKSYVQFKHYWVAQGTLPVETQAQYIITPFIERNLLNLVRATSTRRFPVLLQGPTSSGKTSMIEYLARISGNKFVRINNHEHTDIQEYLGMYVSNSDGRLEYQDGVLVQALKEGYWIVLDELNLAPTDVLEALNRLLDDNRELLVPETQHLVRPHENFMLFATQNPPGIYGGRKTLSRAFKNRFLELHFDDIPADELETILRKRSQIAPSFCARIVAVYKELSIIRQSGRLFEQRNSFATLRDLFRWASRDADDREQLAINGFLLLAERVRDGNERSAVKRVIEDVMKVKIREDQIYGAESLQKLLGRPLPNPQGIVWTRSMRRLYVLVTQAMRSNEPVLLVGETGSGKTSICQVIAETMNTQLRIVNAHQNMETGDLIGAQRPIRNRELIERQLVSDLIAILKDCDAYNDEYGSNYRLLSEVYVALQSQSPGKLSHEMQYHVEKTKARMNALFEWSDGSLVQAMRAGQHFLLDEISLADDSVLERLNSLLEPSRTLFLAEKGSEDSIVIASTGFQFLATMNPGGDYGKRELSPALRNRFTEIWVPVVSEKQEILEIIKAKLSPTYSNLSTPMANFAAWFAATFDTATPNISIRDLLSWTGFINSFKGDTQVAVLHGAAMVYLDRLGANPAAKLSISEANISRERQNSVLKLEEFFDLDLVSLYNQQHLLIHDDRSFRIGPFNLSKNSPAAIDPQYSLQAPTTQANAMKIMRALPMRKPILLEGSPGVGKTTLIAALAGFVGMPLTRINLSDQTDLMDLFGSDVPLEGANIGHFGWREAPFLRAMQKGEWVLLDEMNLASQSVLEGLNSCLDHRGEVFVSELNQTFTRHPGFVLFAAQNPHHQGGGRKGLPASFVNRFTVVYADSFTAQDLEVICAEVFPNSAVKVTETLVRCVTDLNILLQGGRHVGIQGGPWEINLRDILRWLHLLTSIVGSIHVGIPADYINVLFLQRFRSSRDLSAISSSLKQQLTFDDQPRCYYHALSADAVEVGLAVLKRNSVAQPLPGRPFKIANQVALQIAESVMLCVQNNWPCLLVGPSGSGKTNVILQISRLVGADITDLALNPEMDTMDLIGGYEQSDNQRMVAGFLNGLQAYTRGAMIEQLMTHDELDHHLVGLESFHESPTDLAVLVPFIQKLAERYPQSQYPQFLDEVKNLMRQSIVSNQARFEWVDGILVRALKEGKWLILDNANLCNPSVLDRLNSLLEPDGFLSINEYRTASGSPYVVHPHPSFRLFLTMDPRHGELSRAMRNRSIELFMPTHPPLLLYSQMVEFNFESAISSFYMFQAIDWNKMEDIGVTSLLALCFDHLTFADFRLFRRWQAQIAIGMSSLSTRHQNLFFFVAKIYQQMVSRDGVTMSGIRAAYSSIASGGEIQVDIGSLQSIHPFNNPILCNSSSLETLSIDLYYFGESFELLVDLYRLDQRLSMVTEVAQSKAPSQMSRLERSITSIESRRSRNDSTQPLAEFLQEMGFLVRSLVDDKDIGGHEERQDALPFARAILSYLQDIFDLAQAPLFDEGVFQAYQSIGRVLARQFGDGPRSRSHKMSLAEGLGHKLDRFDTSWKLYSGLGMERLWSTFRPYSASTMTQLELALKIEKLSDRFDSLIWACETPLASLNTLRSSLVAFHGSISSPGDVTAGSLQEIESALDGLETGSRSMIADTSPHFQDQFEALTQYGALSSTGGSSGLDSVLELLAGKPTKASMHYGPPSKEWGTLSKLQQVTGQGKSRMELATVRMILPTSTLGKLAQLGEVHLNSLDLVGTELRNLGKVIAQRISSICHNQLGHLQSLLITIHEMARQALVQDSGAVSLEQHKTSLGLLPPRLRGEDPDRAILRGRTHAEMEISSHLYRALETIIESPSLESQREGNCDRKSIQTRATHWLQFFTGCLLFYVPDRPFDPALTSTIARDRHHKRRRELQIKIRSLQDFETIYSGQTSNYRIYLAEKSLISLGREPEVVPVIRPEISELGQLQGEFNNILRSIILLAPDANMVQGAVDGDEKLLQDLEVRRRDISTATTRLSTQFRAYDDITRPLVVMLQGLDIGLALAQLSATEWTQEHEAIKHICGTIPFLGAEPRSLLRSAAVYPKDFGVRAFDARFLALKVIATVRSIDRIHASVVSQVISRIFHSFYEEWREQLGQDRQRYATDSSLYRYRDAGNDSTEAEQEELSQLFPDYERIEEAGNKNAAERPNDPSMLAQCLSRLQYQLFMSSAPASERIIDLLRDASTELASFADLDLSPVPTESMLSVLILSLDRSVDALKSKEQVERLYNFYTDPNTAEAQKLVSLIHKIQSRFFDLQEAWPEHATLEDVIRTCTELLRMRHTEPVARIMTKAEQLYTYVHEWQVVASRESTAANLYDQLTELLVHWRRLELSSWARLLDMEDKNCKTDADSWWFIAYEAIVAAPLSMVESQQDIGNHAEGLFSTLEGFLATTSLGQHSHRLDIIECFKCHVGHLAFEYPALQTIHQALSNFLSYNRRFSKPIRETVRKGRSALEKDLKEILLLASWKDTNIVALRDSAKRSHHKLFKVVRKYRALLAQSANTILMQDVSKDAKKEDKASFNVNALQVAQADPRALDICRQHISDWATQPARFKNPDATSQRMRLMAQTSTDIIDGSLRLDAFAEELVDSIKLLQKETPPEATKDNGNFIKHLKSRKRKLLSETLRMLRNMGFRSNLGANLLEMQASTAAILSKTPSFESLPSSERLSEAESHFHGFLNVMPEVKRRSRNHSDDLTHGDVNRSIGYLENIILVILEQRKVLAASAKGYESLEKTCRTMADVWVPDLYHLSKSNEAEEIFNFDTLRAVRWLSSIVKVGCVIIEKHAKLGETEAPLLVAGLLQWNIKLKDILETIDGLPRLPPAITSSLHKQHYTKAKDAVQELKAQLNGWIDCYPSSAFVLNQIQLWTDFTGIDTEAKAKGMPCLTISDFEGSISIALDYVLVAVQRVQETLSSLPISDDDPNWLLRSDMLLSRGQQELHPAKIAGIFEDALYQTQRIESSSDETLRVTGALCALALPILDQYRAIVWAAFERHAKSHESLCKLGYVLANNFFHVVQEGFCSPLESSAADSGKTEKLEGGTGLGEGEGGEDISKDIQNDEDLSELAQQPGNEKREEDVEEQDDAVTMDHEDLEGEIGDVSDKGGDDDGSGSNVEGDEVDDETGSVDDLDPSALDEKMWDGRKDEEETEKEGSEAKGKAEKDEEVVAQSGQQKEDVNEHEGQDDEGSEVGADEGEEIKQDKAEKMDSQAQESQNLDLPEEMDLDNADGTASESESGDDGMSGLSDAASENDEVKDEDQMEDGLEENSKEVLEDGPRSDNEEEKELGQDGIKDGEDGSPVDTEPEIDDEADGQGPSQDHGGKTTAEQDSTAEAQEAGRESLQDNRVQENEGKTSGMPNQDTSETSGQDGNPTERMDRTESGTAGDGTSNDSGRQAIKKLGDALERWHRQQKQIRDASERLPEQEVKVADAEMPDQEFEHLQDDEAQADAQALGTASDEQARPLDEQALDSEMPQESRPPPPDQDVDDSDHGDDEMRGVEEIPREANLANDQARPSTFIANVSRAEAQIDKPNGAATFEHEDDLENSDNDLALGHLQVSASTPPARSEEEARKLWSHYETLTHDLSLYLTEQLRLILAPTLATKMRGDFRTGKRLNIKRIIPYIASQYKRDKIWMRRSVPSKRNYQIMLAVDDSQSMGDSGSGALAFESLALVAKSLSMLEVGEICVVGFGEDVVVAHEFDKPFSPEAGVKIFQQFSFHQTKTNVRKLVTESIVLFRDARRKTFNPGVELWQLMLIISDGVCEDHETIRRLVRQAQEERLMILFVIVDALLKGESIVHMRQAIFEADADGESKLRIQRYLDGFPFQYYLVVGDVRELPGVLSQALRQWFAEVVESGYGGSDIGDRMG